MSSNKSASEPQLIQLERLPLWRIMAACDLLCMHFGKRREVPIRFPKHRRGQKETVGDFALHINIPWRFHRNHSIWVGSQDMYYCADPNESYDWENRCTRRFDVYAQSLNHALDSNDFVVERVLLDEAFGFRLELSQGLIFDAMPNVSTHTEGKEFWRLFTPATDGDHLVVGTERDHIPNPGFKDAGSKIADI